MLQKFVRQQRSKWQLFFLFSALMYGASTLHFLTVKPGVKFSPAVLRNLDTISMIVVVFLALVIFQIKKRYFSARFIRQSAETWLQDSPRLNEEDLLRALLQLWQGKLLRVWSFAAAIIGIGVLFYWITFWSRNMHIYFAVGGLSLLINYPQKAMFQEVPWLIRQEIKEARKPAPPS